LVTRSDDEVMAAPAAAEVMLTKPMASVRAARVDAEVPKKIKQDAYHLGENDMVQTGPGAPTWLWNAISLRSSSPVPEDSQISVRYSPPWMTTIWRVLSVLLALTYGGLLMLSFTRKIMGTAERFDGTDASPSGAAATILLVGQRGKRKLQNVAHSPVGFAVEAGLLDESEAMHHEDRHIVSNMLGAADMRIEVGSSRRIAPRDTLLIASDGLSDNLDPEEMVERMRAGPLLEGARRLAADRVRRRVVRGGHVDRGAGTALPRVREHRHLHGRRPLGAIRRAPRAGSHPRRVDRGPDAHR